ncbi:hypothetical protein GCM10020367_12690 [Streptomyces sannanensis]|uniref:Transposase n=1 Tax=Streptomyces sannanensis TaxID=285536 RepID=A0ABP6S6P7_9ACTN
MKETATTTSDAHDLPHAEYGRTAAAKLTRYDRMMARRRPKKGQAASKGYRAAKRLRAKLYKKVARQRQDTGRKWAKGVHGLRRRGRRAQGAHRAHQDGPGPAVPGSRLSRSPCRPMAASQSPRLGLRLRIV